MKYTKYLMAAALAVLALGCNKEQVGVEGTPDGQKVTVTFTAGLPGTPATKAIGDGTTAKNLAVAVYEDNGGAAGNYLQALDKTATFTDLKAMVNFSLVKGKTYHFIFWAQASDNAPYTFDKDAKEINVSYAGDANDESRDAFFAVKSVKVTGAMTEPVELHRPFAQVNFGTGDFDAAKAAGVEPKTSVVVATDVATVFDPFAGEGKNPTTATTTVETAFTAAALPTNPETITVESVDYKYLVMNYIIPTGLISEKHVTNLTATFTDAAGQNVEVSVPSAPIQSNWRTNIVGNLLTDQVVFNVEIKPAFETPDNVIDFNNITTSTELQAVFATGGEAKLAGDIVLDKTISVPAGKSVVLDLDGHTINNTTDIWDESTNSWSLISVAGGSLTIKNGTVKAKADDVFAVDVQDGGTVIIEDGTFVGNMHSVYVYEGTAKIYGGHFSIQQQASLPNPYGYVLNCYDDNRKNGTASIIVYGGEFEKFNPADCVAEGAGTNFVADGYKSVKVGDSYYVSKDDAPISVGVSGQDELEDVIANIPAGEKAEITLSDGTYTLPTLAEGTTISGQTGNEVIDCASTTTVSAKDVTVSNVTIKGNGAFTNGSSLAMNGENSTVSGCTFKNGRQYTYGSDLSVSNGAGSVATVSDCDFRKSGFRGVMIWNTGDEVKIDNCLFDNTYPFNCDGGTGKITVTDSELMGWTSYTSGLELVSFTNCKFGKSTSGYAYLIPYSKTIVKDCTFSADFLVSPSGSAVFTIEFINCKYSDGTAITSAIMDTDADNKNAKVLIDGVTYNY